LEKIIDSSGKRGIIGELESDFGPVAQFIEQEFSKFQVAGEIPAGVTTSNLIV